MWHNCFSRCSRPIGMKKLSYKNRCKVACHAHELTLFTGHKQMFIHTHVTRSPPIGIAKLSEVFMKRRFRLCNHYFVWFRFFQRVKKKWKPDLHVRKKQYNASCFNVMPDSKFHSSTYVWTKMCRLKNLNWKKKRSMTLNFSFSNSMVTKLSEG